MNDKFPLMDYRIWEINWLNEFWNHQIAQNKIFLEVENIGCEFVYTELCERHSGKILLRPDENELTGMADKIQLLWIDLYQKLQKEVRIHIIRLWKR